MGGNNNAVGVAGLGAENQNDFPYYNGLPVAISAGRWFFLLLATALGFATLMVPIPWFVGGFGQFVPALLFVLIPLAGLKWVAPTAWAAIFRPLHWRDIGWMILFALINIAVTLAVGALYLHWFGSNANPAIEALTGLSSAEALLFFLKTIPQLFGEELFSIIPFLAFMTLFSRKLNLSRGAAIALAWLLCAIIFAAAHLPTYGWNFFQCFLIIGTARIILLMPYLVTKNIWVSTGAHIINDWLLFAMAILGASLAA